ncbi:glycosyltransferase family 2 protein [Shewanella sp. TC10]|uniref:glycosyltransferase family 2 protein n=1 Tax=Shewanella sp. TC10 TaxID=1419739 RepID=UPI001E4AC8CE|nr:glycosyltransferase family 2 protein [Shewanella sp. TC10]
MIDMNGFIESFSNGILSGWVVANEQDDVQLFCGEQYLNDVSQKYFREDIVSAGLTEGNSGFAIDVKKQLEEMCGNNVFSLRVNGKIVSEVNFYIPNSKNIIKNSFFELADKFNLTDTKHTVNHRVGQTFERFISPTSLQFTNGGYTRLAFADKHNTKELFELALELDLEDIDPESEFPFEFGLVARASHVCNLHIRFIDKSFNCVLDEPIAVTQGWDFKKIQLPADLSQKVRQGEISVVLRAKHYGRRTIDLSMLCLSESLSLLKTPIQAIKEADTQKEISNLVDNTINNGELTSWSNGVVFPNLARGQELADNWFLEMNKGNENKLNVAVVADQMQVDPLAVSLESNLGLRIRAGELVGYSRVITTINKQHLSVNDYSFELDIEAMTLNKKVLLPRIYLIARNAIKDVVVADIARKVTVQGRQLLSFEIAAKQLEKILFNQAEKPVLALAIDLNSGADFSVFSAKLINSPVIADGKDKLSEQQLTQGLSKTFDFEDESITLQLGVLKGLNAWSNGDTVAFENTADEQLIPYASNSNEFISHIANLTPHKMHRPTRSFPFIDIIVPVYNACDDVLLCLSALIEKTDLTHRVIVINDGEDARTAEMLAAFNDKYSHFELVTNPQNIGYTKSVNKGINHSNAEWVIVLNSDTIVSKGWLGKLMNCALSDDKVGMVGALSNAASWQSIPRIHDETGDWHLNPLPKGMTIDQLAEKVSEHSIREYPSVGVINGFCQLINMSMLDQIGLLDEVAFPVGYGEENDMCARAIKADYKLLIADDTYVFHAKSKSFGHEKRKVLAKQGSAALKKKHPDVDWNVVTKLIRENPALNELREQMVLEFKNFQGETA